MVTLSLQRFLPLSTFQILPALLPLRLRRPDHAGRSDPGQFYVFALISRERLADDRFGESRALLRIFWPA